MLRTAPPFLQTLSNDNLSAYDNFIIWMNLFGAIFAAWQCFRAASQAFKVMRPIFLVTGALACLYIVSYIGLLFEWWDVDHWSGFMRGVSVPVWYIVWAGPALYSLRITKGYKERANRLFHREVRNNDGA